MRIGVVAAVLAAIVVLSVGCSGGKGACAPGTFPYSGPFDQGEGCYPYNPYDTTPPVVTVNPPPVPARVRAVGDVTLTTDKPATIFYTTDGSPATSSSASGNSYALIPGVPSTGVVRYFAVDLGGHASQPQIARWMIDTTGPPPPNNFALTVAGSERTVSWTPGADPEGDLQGVLLARVEGALTSPTPGQSYSVGDTISPGVTVVRIVGVGSNGSFSESRTVSPGIVRYVAWSFDDLMNYGAGASRFIVVPAPPQTGHLTVSAATGTVGVPTAPSNVGLSGSATLSAGTLSVTLSLQNNTTRVLFAPKVLATNFSGTAGTWTNPDGTYPGPAQSFRIFGGAVAPGQTVSRTLTFATVQPTDTLAFDVTIKDNPVLAGASWNTPGSGSVFDPVGRVQATSLGSSGPARGPRGSQSLRGGAVTLDGRVILGSRNSSYLTSYDLSTGVRRSGVQLSPVTGCIPRLVMDSNGAVGYALVTIGHVDKAVRNGFDAALVQFDAASLTESARLDIGVSQDRDLQLSPDGTLLAIATGNSKTVLVDLATFRIRELIPVRARALTFLATDQLVTVSSTDIQIWQLQSGSPATQLKDYPLPTAGGTNFAGSARVGPDGRLWIGKKSGVIAFNLADGTFSSSSQASTNLDVFGGSVWVTGSNGTTIDQLATDLTVQGTVSVSSGFYGHWIGHSPF